LRQNQDRLMETIDPVAGAEETPRVPLDALLDPAQGPGQPKERGEAG
jgi:hypothetical protein